MNYFKDMWLLFAVAMLVSCSVSTAEKDPTRTVTVTPEACHIASRNVITIIKMLKEGNPKITILSYLDQEPIDVENAPDVYVGVMLSKTVLAGVNIALDEAFAPDEIIERHKVNCMMSVGKQYIVY